AGLTPRGRLTVHFLNIFATLSYSLLLPLPAMDAWRRMDKQPKSPLALNRTGLLIEVLEELSDNVAVWDSHLRLVYANRTLRNLWNAGESEFLGRTLRELPFSTVDP